MLVTEICLIKTSDVRVVVTTITLNTAAPTHARTQANKQTTPPTRRIIQKKTKKERYYAHVVVVVVVVARCLMTIFETLTMIIVTV